MLGMASGDRMLAPFGQHALADLSQAPDRQAKAQLHQEQAAEKAAMNSAMANPQGLAALRKVASDMGYDAAQLDGPALMKLLPTLEKGYAAREGNATRALLGKQRLDERAAAKEAKDTASLDKRFTQFGQELDPTKARGGEMAKAYNLQLQADRLLKLVDEDPNPNAQKIYELARGMDRLVSGASPTIGATSHLVPQSALGSVNDFLQWMKNAPQGRDQQAFVKQMVDTITRERGVVSDALRSAQGKKASRYSDLAAKDKARFLAELDNYTIGEDEFDPATWAYKGKAKAAPVAKGATAAAPHAQDAAAVEWAKANPNDPRAAKILQLAGAR